MDKKFPSQPQCQGTGALWSEIGSTDNFWRHLLNIDLPFALFNVKFVWKDPSAPIPLYIGGHVFSTIQPVLLV